MEESIQKWYTSALPGHRQRLERELIEKQRSLDQQAESLQNHRVFTMTPQDMNDGNLYTIAMEMVRVTRDMLNEQGKSSSSSIETTPLTQILIWMDMGQVGSSAYYVRSFYSDFWRVYKQQVQDYARSHLNNWINWNPHAESKFFEQLTLLNLFTNVLYTTYVQPRVESKVPIYRVFQNMEHLIRTKQYTPNRQQQTKKSKEREKYNTDKAQLDQLIHDLGWLCPSFDLTSNTKVDHFIQKVVLPKLTSNDRLLHKRHLEDLAIHYIRRQYQPDPVSLLIHKQQDKVRSRIQEQEQEGDKLMSRYSLCLQSFLDKTENITLDHYRQIIKTMSEEVAIPEEEEEPPPIDRVFEHELYELDHSILHLITELLSQRDVITHEDHRHLMHTLKERFIRQEPMRIEEEKEEEDQPTPLEEREQRVLDQDVVRYRVYVASRLWNQLTEYHRGLLNLLTVDPWVKEIVEKEIQYQCEGGGVQEYMDQHTILWKDVQHERFQSQLERVQQRYETLTWVSNFLHTHVLPHHQHNKDVYNLEINDTTLLSQPDLHQHSIPTPWLSLLLKSKGHTKDRTSCPEVYRLLVQEAAFQHERKREKDFL